VMQQAARRRQAEEQAQAAQQPAPLPLEDQPLEDVWGRAPAAVPAPPPLAVQPPRRSEAPAPLGLHPARALLKDRRDLRRAVVLMMVLGPCRAQEPLER
jgi:hypothetical protein